MKEGNIKAVSIDNPPVTASFGAALAVTIIYMIARPLLSVFAFSNGIFWYPIITLMLIFIWLTFSKFFALHHEKSAQKLSIALMIILSIHNIVVLSLYEQAGLENLFSVDKDKETVRNMTLGILCLTEFIIVIYFSAHLSSIRKKYSGYPLYGIAISSIIVMSLFIGYEAIKVILFDVLDFAEFAKPIYEEIYDEEELKNLRQLIIFVLSLEAIFVIPYGFVAYFFYVAEKKMDLKDSVESQEVM